MRRKVIAIVGNADVTKDYSAFIDSCDLVVRLNLRIGLPALMHSRLGNKTDILCYAPRATRLVLDDWAHIGQLTRFFAEARQIWFVGPKRWFRMGPKGIIQFMLRNKRLVFDSSEVIVRAFQREGRRIEYFPRDFRDSVAGTLPALESGAESGFPSAGMVVIQRVLEDPAFEAYEKCVLGFTFEGWHGHPFTREKRLVETYSAKGLLQLLPVD